MLLRRLGLQAAAATFVDASGLPFATMFGDKSVRAEDHPGYIGMYAGTAGLTARLDLHKTINISHHRTVVTRSTRTWRWPTFWRNCQCACPRVPGGRRSHPERLEH
jgi:hypothetical protein